jgi:hypothetical protein
MDFFADTLGAFPVPQPLSVDISTASYKDMIVDILDWGGM